VILLGLLIAGLFVTQLARSRHAGTAEAAEPPRGLPTPVPMSTEDTTPRKVQPPMFAGSLTRGGHQLKLPMEDERKIVERARAEIGTVLFYDNSWMQTSGYPMGDVPEDRGACTDVVVRSLRSVGIDLQQLVHEDVLANPTAYAISQPDIHIDHRRVGSMFTFFQRNSMPLPLDARNRKNWQTFRPGDIVFFAWSFGRLAPPEHVGVVSDKKGPRGLPLVIQNGGPRPLESDTLDRGKIVGHFRALPKPEASPGG
jgi:uncharacterized protein YijF (DUF1287 family)